MTPAVRKILSAGALAVSLTASTWLANPAPAAAQTVKPLVLRCFAPSTFERWGLGTTAASWPGKKPFKGAGDTFDRTYTLDAANRRLEEKRPSSRYGFDPIESLTLDGWTSMGSSVTAESASYRFTNRDQYWYAIQSLSIYKDAGGVFRFKYLDRDEDRNRLIFELFKSEGTCSVVG